MRLTINAHLPFLHRLQQGGLCFGGRAVDFVREQEAGEDRPTHEREFIFLEVIDIRAGNIGGHKIRRELDARKLAAEHARERPHEQRLGHARHAFDERVLAGEDGDERAIHDFALADDDLGNFLSCACENFL